MGRRAKGVVEFEVFTNLNQQGIGKVTKQINEALSGSLIDSGTKKRLSDMASTAARSFNEVVAGATATGLRKEADRWVAKAKAAEEEMARTIAELASAKEKMSTKEYNTHARMLKERMANRTAEIKKEVAGVEKVIARRREAMEKWEKSSGADLGEAMAEGFSSSVDDMWSSVKAADLGGLTKALSGVFKKASGAMEVGAASGAGGAGASEAMGGIAASLAGAAAALAAIAAVVVAIAAVAKAMVDADSQAKEFNSTLLQGASAADFSYGSATDSVHDLSNQLDAARTAALDLALRFRGDTKEILGVMAAANEAGLTFKEMQERFSDSGDAFEAYTALAKTAIVYSKNLGQTQDTIATQVAEWMHDLGGGLEMVESGFKAIYQGAEQSGIGVKRFYTMVTNATSNMALYNVRIEEAAALISTLGESLGEANAGSFVQGLSKGFAADSYTERFKKIIIAGQGDMKEIMENSAVNTAEAFRKKFGGEASDAMKSAVKGSGVDLDLAIGGDAKELAKLGQMSEKQIRQLLQATKSDDEYRELEKLVELSRGMSGNIGDQAKALDAMDMSGKLATILSGGLGGKAISEMSAIELAAFENYAGLSGEQLMELRKVDRRLQGQYDTLETIKKQGGKATKAQEKKLDEIGLELGANGKIYVKDTDKVVDSYNDFAQSQGHILTAAVEKALTDQEALALRQAEDTSSLLNRVETGLQVILEKIYDVMQELLSWASGMGPIERKAKAELLDQLKSEEDALTEKLRENAEEIGKARDAARTSKGEDRKRAKAQLAELESQREVLEAGVDISRAEQRKAGQLQGGWLDNWNDAGEMRQAINLSAEEKADIFGGSAFKAQGLARAGEIADQEQASQAASTFRNMMLPLGLRDMSAEQHGAISEKKRALAEERGVGVSEVSDFDPVIEAMKESFALENIKTNYAREIEEGKLVEFEGHILPVKEVEKLKKRREARVEQLADVTTAKAGQTALDVAQMAPEEVLAEADAAAAEVQTITTQDQTKALTDTQKKEFKKLKKKFPSLTEKGIFEALRKRDMKKIAFAAGKGTKNVQEIFDRLVRGGKLTKSEVVRANQFGNKEILGSYGYATGKPSETSSESDFIYRGGAGGGTITPINQADELLGAKPGGAVQNLLQAAGGGAGGHVTININGGDTAKIYEVVKRAMRESGVRPAPGRGR